MKNRLFKTGLIGSGVLILCCFSPILVIGLGTIGLGFIIQYLDFILLPTLGIFLLLTIYAYFKKDTCCSSHNAKF